MERWGKETMSEPCPFCAGTESLSDEHIIPQWLIDSLGIRDMKIATTHMSTFGFPISRRGPMSMANFVNGRICRNCNTGWMSNLEAEVKPLVDGLMNLDMQAVSALQESRETLARWVIKTAIVLNHCSNYRPLIPSAHFRAIYADAIPDFIHVNLGFTQAEDKFHFRQGQHLLAFVQPSDVHSLPRDGYRISFQFRHLLLRVVYLPFPNMYQTDFSIHIWPVFGRPEDFRLFKGIDDFDLSGGFTQYFPEKEEPQPEVGQVSSEAAPGASPDEPAT